MIERPRSSEFADFGLATDLRDLRTILAPWCWVAVEMAAIVWLCIGGGFTLIVGYTEWFGATVFPGTQSLAWGLIGILVCLYAYARMFIWKRPTP